MSDWRDDAVAETLDAEWKVPLSPDSEVLRGRSNSARTYHLLADTDELLSLCQYRTRAGNGPISRTLNVVTPHYTQCQMCARNYREYDHLTTRSEVVDPDLVRSGSVERNVGGYVTDHPLARCDRDWLEYQLLERGLTPAEVADLDDVIGSRSTIYRWIDRHGIELPSEVAHE